MRVPLKIWDADGNVPMEPAVITQMSNICKLPFVFDHAALMPDGHVGIGGSVGSVVATIGAVVPAICGVDIGCGMMAVRTSLTANDLPDNTHHIRLAIEAVVPHGRTDNGGRNDKGAHQSDLSAEVQASWLGLVPGYTKLIAKYPNLAHHRVDGHLGTLGTGNHFIELCLDEANDVWIMLHSGSRGIGNKIGSFFIALAQKDMEKFFINLPHRDLAYLPEGTEHFDDYVEAVGWAQDYAKENRVTMMNAIVKALGTAHLPAFTLREEAVNCHHNYVQREQHYRKSVLVTRKGAVRARTGDLAIIPGSMGTRSYIVRGKGNQESFTSCSHGAGRGMSRTEAKKRFTLEDHQKATAGIECRKDVDVIDETPAAYKSIDVVMEAQTDLVEVVHKLKQFLVVKG